MLTNRGTECSSAHNCKIGREKEECRFMSFQLSCNPLTIKLGSGALCPISNPWGCHITFYTHICCRPTYRTPSDHVWIQVSLRITHVRHASCERRQTMIGWSPVYSLPCLWALSSQQFMIIAESDRVTISKNKYILLFDPGSRYILDDCESA